ncbi:hypothetical protein HAINFHK1212_0718, partial [Haemophilus influenzae HK1212]
MIWSRFKFHTWILAGLGFSLMVLSISNATRNF